MGKPDAPELVTVVAAGTFDVALDSGRHLAPGELAEVAVTERISQLVEAGALRIADAPARDVPDEAPRRSTPEVDR